MKKKIARFCNVDLDSVIQSLDADTIYDVPLLMKKEGLDEIVLKKLGLPASKEPNLKNWKEFLGKLKNPTTEVTIGLIGKYVELHDSYKSISESLIHAGAINECKVNIEWIQSETLLDDSALHERLKNFNAILVAPGFGERGVEGKIQAVKYARTNKIPFFGICLGMQCSVIEFGRNALELENAHSAEMDSEADHKVIDLMAEQKDITQMGGTMRLGAYPCKLKKGSLAAKLYGALNIEERHRHRYEFNNAYLEQYEKAGMIPSGINPTTGLVEIMEVADHPFFLGTQFHPELKSTVEKPHPVFVGFVKAAIDASKIQPKEQ